MNIRKIQSHTKSYYLLILVSVSILLYWASLLNNFQYKWDDQWMVMNHFTEGGWGLSNLKRIFLESYKGQYSPLTHLSYLFIYTFRGYDPFYFHLYSLLIHIGNVILLFLVLKKIFVLRGENNNHFIHYLSFFTVLVFSIHPLQVETVAWISASKILLYVFFYLFATYTYLCYMEKGKTKYYWLAIFLFVCSFGAKEQAVTFPVWLCLIHWFTKYGFDKTARIKLIPFFILALLMGVVTMSVHYHGVVNVTEKSIYPFWQRVLLGCFSFVEYIYKFVFPFKLSFFYPFPIIGGATFPYWIITYPFLIVLVGCCFYKYLKKPIVVFGLLFYLIHISTTLHILPMSRHAVTADRYVYLGIPGIAIVTIVLFWYFIVKWSEYKNVFYGLITFWLILLISLSFARIKEWQDSNTIKRELIELFDTK